ncbi:hypothetical protein PFISCL1PPCAC_21126, partial [Pristionchus fissidentatus]
MKMRFYCKYQPTESPLYICGSCGEESYTVTSNTTNNNTIDHQLQHFRSGKYVNIKPSTQQVAIKQRGPHRTRYDRSAFIVRSVVVLHVRPISIRLSRSQELIKLQRRL